MPKSKPTYRIVSDTEKSYEHLKLVTWPKDLLGPNHWRPESNLVWHLPKELKETVGRVTESGIRFYQKVKHQKAPKIPGDKTDPDAIHALKFALDRQDELEREIKAHNEYPTELTKSLLLWLQERKRTLVMSMYAVVVAEKGEMYDEANKEPWGLKLVKMTNEDVEYLRFIFRTVMARIDLVPAGKLDVDQIQPNYKEAIVQPEEDSMVSFPPAPPVSYWKIDDSLMENPTLKMHQAQLALYHQGRVLSAVWAKMPDTEQEYSRPLFDVTVRALHLTIRNIDLVWMERQKGLPKEEEERLFVWLLERKNVAVDLRFALMEFQLPPELDRCIVKFDNSGMVYVLRNSGFREWGKLSLIRKDE